MMKRTISPDFTAFTTQINEPMPKLFCVNILLITAFLIPSHLVSQVVWTEPAFPSADDEVVLYFNSALGNGELMGVIPVFIHTGVITSNSSGPSDWQNVQTTWGTSDASALLSPEGNGVHSFDFNGLSLADYYGIDEGEEIESLAMVFRNSSGSLVGRAADNSDIFYAVSNGSFSASLQTPALGYAVLSIDEEFEIIGQASESGELSISINGEVVASNSGSEVTHLFTASEGGQYTVELIANNGSIAATDVASISVLPDSPTTGWPTGNGQDGIEYLSDSSVKLQLHAPGKDFVFAVGDFSDWELRYDFLMTQSPDGNKHWIEIDGLTPGEECRFHYHVMPDDMRVADPYSEKILDPWNDGWIADATYPDLLAFPNMLTENTPVSVMQPGMPEFNWTDQGFTRPEQRSLVIYELLVRDFTDEGNFQTILDTLDYLDRLGINAIEFMPVNEFNGNDSWGYNPTFFLALDKAYGTSEVFKTLINECHNRGIAILLDIVLNHADFPHPYLKLYWDETSFQPAANNPWFNTVAPNPEAWFFDWNHDSPMTKEHMKRILDHWVNEFHVDGYRLDFSKGMTQTPGDGNGYDQNRIDLLNEYANHLWQDDPDLYMILEHWTELSEQQTLVEDGFMVWANATYDYSEAAMGYPSNLSWASYQNQGMSQPSIVSYPESHDEERMMYKCSEFGNGSGAYQIDDLNTALERMEAIQCFNILLPGPKMIWQFEELGYDYSINTCSDGVTISENCRTESKPVRWDYRNNPNRYRIHEVISGLCKLKHDHPGTFNSPNYNWDVNGYGKRLHLNGDMNAVVVANFKVDAIDMIPGFQHTGEWWDYFTGESINVSDISAFMNFAPGEYHVYVDQTLDFPSPVLETATHSIPEAPSLYPNPTNNYVFWKLPIDQASPYDVKISNHLGQTVREQIGQRMIASESTLEIDCNALPRGIYLIQVNQGNQTFTSQLSVQPLR